MKKYLAEQDITTAKQLQRQLDRFVAYYNDERPHRGIERRTPMAGLRRQGESRGPRRHS